MRLGELLRAKSARPSAQPLVWRGTAAGITFEPSEATGWSADDWFSGQSTSPIAVSVLDELVEEDYAARDGVRVCLSWDQVYGALASTGLASGLSALELPPIAQVVPKLASRGTLTDPSFSIEIAGWIDDRRRPASPQALLGALIVLEGEHRLLPSAAFRLLRSVREFSDRKDRGGSSNRFGWGKVRHLARECGADVDDFLMRSVVLAPEKLDVQFRKLTIADTSVVEVQPTFEGAPSSWLQVFDSFPEVRSHYALSIPGGIVHVELPEATRSVLREIKRWPARRAAGARAEAFLINPIAAMGDDAAVAIDLDQFEHAKAEAGVVFDRFTPSILHDALGHPAQVAIKIESPSGDCTSVALDDTSLGEFVRKLRQRLDRDLQLLAWRDFEFILDGEARRHLAALEAALDARSKPPILIQRDQIFDLSGYSQRVTEIGEHREYISTYIVKKSDEDGWFPSNLFAIFKFMPSGGAGEVTVPVTLESLPDIEVAIERAKLDGAAEVVLPGAPIPIPTNALEKRLDDLKCALADPDLAKRADDQICEVSRKRRLTLIIHGNIENIGHAEKRADALALGDHTFHRPRSLKPTVDLREHQKSGIARLQHLFANAPTHCRGVLLADDMGLGKTIQLLTFIVNALERDASLPPALIVAPVALLQNWRDEIDKFFAAGAVSILTAYGDKLASLRVPRASVDTDLQSEGLVRFLREDWRGNARIVLTTYETLRDLEFSFAREKWSILVCDEAQKVKNPNAGVTRAAKKLNVHFRVACTGTPVENSLSDLWCLFDLIQPGLLGALNEFGKVFGRPIEVGGEHAASARRRLQTIIDPQVIRRTKVDVAKDLPRRIDVTPCTMPMSQEQRDLYVNGVRLLAMPSSHDEAEPKVHHLGLLAHFRLVCADPRHYGIQAFVPEEPLGYLRRSPKMAWLLATLRTIKAKGEKVLLFAEHRDIQRLLQYYIANALHFRPAIVNGDTSVSVKATQSRKRLIDDFQAAPGFGVIILSPLAVGFGVNIQAANHIIHYLRHWNPAKEDQATDRAYRIGQTKDVHVYCPLVVADDFQTFDVKLDAYLRRKRLLATDMLHAAGRLEADDIGIDDMIPPGGWPEGDRTITSEDIERAAPQFFEAMTAALWTKQGYRSHLTERADGGVDVVAIKGDEGVLLQCKSTTSDRPIGWEAVKDVSAGAAIYAEKFPTIRFTKIGVTNKTFNARAHDRARANGVVLIEGPKLEKMALAVRLRLVDVVSAGMGTRV